MINQTAGSDWILKSIGWVFIKLERAARIPERATLKATAKPGNLGLPVQKVTAVSLFGGGRG